MAHCMLDGLLLVNTRLNSMIVKEVNFDMFLNSFSDNYKQNFTYEGKKVLFEYLENYGENVTGEPLMLDMIAICCEYTEYENFEELQKNYNVQSMEELEDNTTVLLIPNTDRFIIESY